MRSSSAATSFVRVRASRRLDGDVLGAGRRVEGVLPKRERLFRRAERAQPPFRAPLARASGGTGSRPRRVRHECAFHRVGAGRRSRLRNAAGSVARRAEGLELGPSSSSSASSRASDFVRSFDEWPAAAGRRARGRSSCQPLCSSGSRASRPRVEPVALGAACGNSRAGPPSAPALPARRARRAAGTRRRAAPQALRVGSRRSPTSVSSPLGQHRPQLLEVWRRRLPVRKRCPLQRKRPLSSARLAWWAARDAYIDPQPQLHAFGPSLHPAAHSIRAGATGQGRRTGLGSARSPGRSQQDASSPRRRGQRKGRALPSTTTDRRRTASDPSRPVRPASDPVAIHLGHRCSRCRSPRGPEPDRSERPRTPSRSTASSDSQGPADRARLGRGARRGRRNARRRGRSRPHLRPREDRGGLLQVQEQDRHRHRRRGAARLPRTSPSRCCATASNSAVAPRTNSPRTRSCAASRA